MEIGILKNRRGLNCVRTCWYSSRYPLWPSSSESWQTTLLIRT